LEVVVTFYCLGNKKISVFILSADNFYQLFSIHWLVESTDVEIAYIYLTVIAKEINIKRFQDGS
jgi:hypothetical protein